MHTGFLYLMSRQVSVFKGTKADCSSVATSGVDGQLIVWDLKVCCLMLPFMCTRISGLNNYTLLTISCWYLLYFLEFLYDLALDVFESYTNI